MAVEERDVARDIKIENVEQEKIKEEKALQELYQRYILPGNISEMKSFAWGKFTWRDVSLSIASIIIPVVILLPFQSMIPLWLCIVIGIALGIPGIFIVNKHIFTGDLPIEERLKISLSNRGQSDLLNWDKTKENGKYVDLSTQSIVPELEFSDDNMVFLPNNKGGFAVIQITANDMIQNKFSDTNKVVFGFNNLLNRLIDDTNCTPIQIMLKSVPKNLSKYIDKSLDDAYRITTENKPVMAACAEDYASLLQSMDTTEKFYYNYYVIVTYREDAEDVGNNTMKSMSTRRLKMKEKINPLQKKQKIAANMDFEIGENRKEKIKEMNKERPFSKKLTKTVLEKRVDIVLRQLRNLGPTTTEVKGRLLGKNEIAKMVFECYNDSDKGTIDEIISQAIEEHPVLWAPSMYVDFPELFPFPKKEQTNNTLNIQKRGVLSQKIGE